MIVQLKKGVLEFCILSIIAKEELYGYEIMKRMTEKFEDTSEQTIYTILRRMLSEGHTACYAKDISAGPPRKYYRITESGSIYLEQCRQAWKQTRDAVESII